jgi:hypothetical protein
MTNRTSYVLKLIIWLLSFVIFLNLLFGVDVFLVLVVFDRLNVLSYKYR